MASVMLTPMLLAMDTEVLVWALVDSSASPASTLATVDTPPVDSLTSSVSALLMPMATAMLPSALWAVLAFTLLVPLTATDPHREPMVSVMPKLTMVTAMLP